MSTQPVTTKTNPVTATYSGDVQVEETTSNQSRVLANKFFMYILSMVSTMLTIHGWSKPFLLLLILVALTGCHLQGM